MDGFVKSEGIVLLFDSYSRDSRNLHGSFRRAGCDCPAMVIEDDGFLPEDVMSVYGFFLGDFKEAESVPGKPRYFNQITVPEYWEISGTNSMGRVHDLSRERGKIFYAEPLHRRLVKVVDWYDEKKTVRSSDHYNRYGALYARTTFNAGGKKVNKSYFSPEGREVIVENFVTGDIILNDGPKIRFFHTKTEFVAYALEKAGFGQSRIFFNSLSTPFFVSQRLPGREKGDILFWQEPVGAEIPGNMQIILRGEASRTAEIMVQKEQPYERLLELGAPAETVHRLGFIYPFVKENQHGFQALICTNSDQIVQCGKIVEALPQMHFHIAALTEMSSRLMSMGSYENVSLYPGVKTSVLDQLFQECDYYLDINRESEIVSAVYKAFLHNQLIFAFKETAHNRSYTAKEHVYRAEDADGLIGKLRAVMADEKKMDECLRRQKEAAMAEEEERYRRFCV